MASELRNDLAFAVTILIGAFSKPFSGTAPLPVVPPAVMEQSIDDIREYVNGNPAVRRSCSTTSSTGARG